MVIHLNHGLVDMEPGAIHQPTPAMPEFQASAKCSRSVSSCPQSMPYALQLQLACRIGSKIESLQVASLSQIIASHSSSPGAVVLVPGKLRGGQQTSVARS